MIIRRLLIANRGEIAVRVMRTCERLGVETVLAASAADMDSVAARRADRVYCIGPAPASQSYLSVDAVMACARAAQVDAIHPGYGFLSENELLASACEAAGIVFVGPTAAQLHAVGDKLRAIGHAVEAGLPVVPGGEAGSPAGAQALAREIGYPILIKAVGGGGGRGLHLLHSPERLAESLDRAIAEAQAAFGNPRIYLERYIAAGRHVEVQVLGDGEKVIHLGTRDCSIQRRYQKLLEEAPAPQLRDALREEMQSAAAALARHLRYRGLGTVEFLLDAHGERFYFLEMNARIQVEHPVTEAITGIDLVAEQIAVAEGRGLRLSQSDVVFSGHAVECRINAEDWRRDFAPSPGELSLARFAAGEGIRIDTHVQNGTRVPPFYDSLLAKLIVHGRDRDEALARLAAALGGCELAGVDSTLGLHRLLAREPAFVRGGVDTAFFPPFLQRQLAAREAR